MDDEILKAGIKNGDIKAFEKLFETYYTRLTFYANRFLNEMNASEEIVSEMFASLWEKRKEVVIVLSIQSYLYRAVQNRCLNLLKRRRVENDYVNYLIRNDLLEKDHHWDLLPGKDLEEQARKAIDLLPEKCREIFKLSRYQHLKNREIAQKLNLSQKTVERQITIALEKLREHLKNSLRFFFF